MGFDFRPSSMDLTPEQYMAEYGTQRRAWLADKAGFDATIGEDGEVLLVERPKVERIRGSKIVHAKRRVEEADLGVAAKKVYKAASALGLDTRAWLMVSDVEPVLYVNDSDEKATSEHRAGDVRYPQKYERRYVIEARLPGQPLGFQAHYVGEGLEGKTGSFETARIRDPYGVEVENKVDYTRDSNTAKDKGWSEERRIQEGMAMNARINDGTFRAESVRLFTAGGDFTRWLDEYLTIKGLAPITPKRKVAPTPEEREVSILAGGDWNG